MIVAVLVHFGVVPLNILRLLLEKHEVRVVWLVLNASEVECVVDLILCGQYLLN